MDNLTHAGVFVKLIGSLVLAFDGQANLGEAACFKGVESMLKVHAPRISAAVVGAVK
jgi:hypothetical protein